MKICGVVAEYNPFHNGHKYQLSEARRLSGCDYIIAVMGGAFSQRGEVMLLDKWTRARMALLNGADLVVELPALFAVRSADTFARGGVLTLAGLGADSICFGCETDDTVLLDRMLDCLMNEDSDMREAVRSRLEQGQSHVRARGGALAERLGIDAQAVSAPNTALALEYMRVNQGLERPMQVHVVRRTGGYHDPSVTALASASAIRSAVEKGEDISHAMPPDAYGLLIEAKQDRLADMTRLDALLIDRLRCMAAQEIAALPDVNEGLEYRVSRCVQDAGSRETLLDALKCKRYTHARLSRLLAHAMLGITREKAASHPVPEYARVLGFRKDAAPLLTHLKEQSLPLITKAAMLKGNGIFAVEMRATDLQSLTFGAEEARRAGRDMTERMVLV